MTIERVSYLKQGYQPLQSDNNQQRNRRTERYKQQDEQKSQHKSSGRSRAETGFPEHERMVYQPVSNLRPANSEQRHKAHNTKNRTQRRIIVWATVAIIILIVGTIGRENANTTETPSQSKLPVSISASPVPHTTATVVVTPTNSPSITKQVFTTLLQGSIGDDVKQLQQRLIQLGYLDDVVDGFFGSKTYKAVTLYQSQNSLTNTGIADSNTLSSLYSSNAKMADRASVTPEPIQTTSSSLNMSTSQRNAVSSAKSYLAFTSFSYDGLIEQLEYEKFSHSDAVFGADNCGADWSEQALSSAKTYLDYSAFSYDGLVDQLIYEQFTAKQAHYGADNCGADWNEQASKSAKTYLDFSSFSRAGLIDQLEYEGFTHSQAVYGVTANGY